MTKECLLRKELSPKAIAVFDSQDVLPVSYILDTTHTSHLLRCHNPTGGLLYAFPAQKRETQCASLHLGSMPRIEEHPDGQGYRFTWEAITSRKTRLICIIYKWNIRSISDMLLEVCSAPCDVMTASIEQVMYVLAWLKTLAEPAEEEIAMITESTMDAMSRLDAPQPGFSWCGYGWKTHCPLLGDMLVALGITFPTSSICSSSLLVACWRQIAQEMEKVLAC